MMKIKILLLTVLLFAVSCASKPGVDEITASPELLNGEKFFGTTFNDMVLKDIVIEGTKFSKSRINNMVLDNVTLIGVRFDSAKLVNPVFRDVTFKDCVFYNTTLERSSMSNISFDNVTFEYFCRECDYNDRFRSQFIFGTGVYF